MSLEIKREKEEEIYSNFINSLRSQKTKDTYDNSLKVFMKFHNIESYSQLLESPDIEQKIKGYVLELVHRELSTSFKQIFMSAIKHFF
jgi:site-specific recombinase XerD